MKHSDPEGCRGGWLALFIGRPDTGDVTLPRSWTWLVMIALTVSAIVLVDRFNSPLTASADPGSSLTKPIEPLANKERMGRHRNRIAWFHAQKRYGRDMPMGRGIEVGQVEASQQRGYMADSNKTELRTTSFIAESGANLISPHATRVAIAAFGPDSAGQGVTKVHGWQVNDWMGKGYLNTGTALDPNPKNHPVRVFNHSWIGSGSRADALVLRRIDYLVDKHDVIIVCGVNNKPGKIPNLLASAYNVISVGVLSGNNSDGLTTIEGPGRSKPEISASRKLTSYATGTVTGVVAALLEQADRKVKEAKAQAKEGVGKTGRNQDAARSEVIKALLLAGAFRPGRWKQLQGEPLDRKLGAGITDLDRALVMLDAGHVEPSDKQTTNQRYGWSFSQIQAGKTKQIRFEIDKPQGDTSIALTWHRRVLGGQLKVKDKAGNVRMVWNAAQFTPNLDLTLVKIAADGSEKEVASSSSKADNVEFIRLRTLPAGNYALRVKRAADKTNMDWDFALAWRIEALLN